MKPIECIFSNESLRSPFVRKVHSYDISGGFLDYDGYFNSEKMLPLECILNLYQFEEEPYKVEGFRSFYNYVFQEINRIEIYKHERFEDTSVFSEADEDGLKYCFMPTHREKIWFRVL
jgi:hypothetical protein